MKPLPTPELVAKLHSLIEEYAAGRDAKGVLNEMIEALPKEDSSPFWLQFQTMLIRRVAA